MDDKAIGRRLRRIREYRHLTQQEVAELTRRHRSTVAKYETGDRPIAARDLPLFSEVLDVEITAFFSTNNDSFDFF